MPPKAPRSADASGPTKPPVAESHPGGGESGDGAWSAWARDAAWDAIGAFTPFEVKIGGAVRKVQFNAHRQLVGVENMRLVLEEPAEFRR